MVVKLIYRALTVYTILIWLGLAGCEADKKLDYSHGFLNRCLLGTNLEGKKISSEKGVRDVNEWDMLKACSNTKK